jgi:hypothetical protein
LGLVTSKSVKVVGMIFLDLLAPFADIKVLIKVKVYYFIARILYTVFGR